MKVEIRFSYYLHEKHGRCLRCDMTVDGVAYEWAAPCAAEQEGVAHAAALNAMKRTLEQAK